MDENEKAQRDLLEAKAKLLGAAGNSMVACGCLVIALVVLVVFLAFSGVIG